TAPSPRSYMALRDEAVKLFNSLQQLESEQDPVPLMQGVLQTCLDLPPLVDEIYCQLVKQTTEPAVPGGQGDLHYWQLLTCMSCTFLPSPPILRFLRLHLDRQVLPQPPGPCQVGIFMTPISGISYRTESRFPASEMAEYASFIREALGKTKGRECVPSLEEILVLMRRQELICTVHCPGAPACSVAISSHTTAEEVIALVSPQVAQELVSRLGLSQSPNLFALYEQSRRREQPVGSATLLADVLTRFE
ncbi:PKHH3 protein, partial [Turnix velox]|nr:PKHH3 protein [Turnix velox]